MVIGAEITPDTLEALSAEERDEKLKDAYDLTEKELENIRSANSIKEGFRRGARLLADKGHGDSIKAASLAAIAYEKWKKPKNHIRYVSTAIGREYGEDRKETEKETRLNLTNIHLLREEVGAYEGNLAQARDYNSEFQNSPEDLLRSIRIPLDIGLEESQLLGAFWSEGTFKEQKTGEKKLLVLQGAEPDQEWYRRIKNRISDVFNLNTSVGVYTAEASEDSFISDDREFPSIIVGSKAVNSWVEDDLGFEEPAPQIEWDYESKAGYLSGFLSGRGSIKNDNRYATSSNDLEMLETMHNYLEDIDVDSDLYRFREGTGSDHRLTIRKHETERLLEMDFFWNPRFKLSSEENS